MLLSTIRLAFDRTARRIDDDGRLHVERSHISKATVNPYYGQEIPGFADLGLIPDKVYRLLRDPVELERSAETFARIPILSKHVPITVDTMLEDDEQKKLVVGAIGSDVAFAAPYLDADLCVWDAAAIAGIETDKVRELSCAYRYDPVMEPGEFEGQPYDGRMTNIRGNHLALVEVGRAGPDVVVADSKPLTLRNSAMKMTKLGKALFAALCAASPVLAADSALPALVGLADRKTFDKKAVRDKLLALDAGVDPQKVDDLLDTMLDVEQEPKPVETPSAAADDESAEAKLRSLLAGKVDDDTLAQACALLGAPAAAADDMASSMTKNVNAAMDSLRVEFREANQALRDVRPVVGDLSMDKAADIYVFALDHMKVDHTDVEGVPALRALFKVASTKTSNTPAPRVAQDSSALDTQFPAASRFRNA